MTVCGGSSGMSSSSVGGLDALVCMKFPFRWRHGAPTGRPELPPQFPERSHTRDDGSVPRRACLLEIGDRSVAFLVVHLHAAFPDHEALFTVASLRQFGGLHWPQLGR